MYIREREYGGNVIDIVREVQALTARDKKARTVDWNNADDGF